MKRKGETRYEGTQEKLQNGICLNNTKKYSFPQRSINTRNVLKKEEIMTKNVQQMKEAGPHKCSSGPVYYN